MKQRLGHIANETASDAGVDSGDLTVTIGDLSLG
jgi:hypothetical protein